MNEKWKVVGSEKFMKQSKDLPEEVYEELTKVILGFKSGEIDPTKIGKPVDYIDLDIKLRCPSCGSYNVNWLLDKNSNEVDFHCLECDESFWMTYGEYKNAIKKNSDCII
jgi:hypothetical protein